MVSKYQFPSLDLIVKFESEMKLRGFSSRTIQSYTRYLREFLDFADVHARSVRSHHVQSYLESLIERDLSPSTVNSAYSALLLYFERILRRKFFCKIPRMKRKRSLPVVLSRAEITDMIDRTEYGKHRCIVELLYKTGLRVGELVKLRIRDIDFDRGLIRVVSGKGGKDRDTVLPPALFRTLLKQQSLKRPSDFLFTNPNTHSSMTTTSIQKIVKQAAARAGILKNVTPHTLRHTFATHLLEKGLDIRYIQELMGHSSITSTQIYTRVSKSDLKGIAHLL